MQNSSKHLRCSFQSWTLFAKTSILDVWQGSKYAFDIKKQNSQQNPELI